MNVNMVLEMFEELKLQLKQLNTKIEQQAIKDSTAVAVVPFDPFQNDPIEKLMELIVDDHRGFKNMIENNHNQIYKSQNVVSKGIAEVKTIITEKAHQHHHHQHSIEIKSSKVFITIAVLFHLIVGSLTYNFLQYNENKRLQNNDLRYRYLKSFATVDETEIKFVEQVFNQNANEDDRKKCLQKLLDFEVDVELRAAKIQQAKNIEQKGKELIKEAESNAV